MGAGRQAAAGGADPAGVPVFPGRQAIEGRGQGPGRAGPAHPFRPQEQIGVGQATLLPGGPQVRDDPLLPQNLPEKHGAGLRCRC